MSIRPIKRLIKSKPTLEGAGVHLRRAFGFGTLLRQMKLGFDTRDHCRCQELAIGVQDEQIAHPVEDDASARPVLVFVRPHNCAQGEINRPVAEPPPTLRNLLLVRGEHLHWREAEFREQILDEADEPKVASTILPDCR